MHHLDFLILGHTYQNSHSSLLFRSSPLCYCLLLMPSGTCDLLRHLCDWIHCSIITLMVWRCYEISALYTEQPLMRFNQRAVFSSACVVTSIMPLRPFASRKQNRKSHKNPWICGKLPVFCCVFSVLAVTVFFFEHTFTVSQHQSPNSCCATESSHPHICPGPGHWLTRRMRDATSVPPLCLSLHLLCISLLPRRKTTQSFCSLVQPFRKRNEGSFLFPAFEHSSPVWFLRKNPTRSFRKPSGVITRTISHLPVSWTNMR